MRRGIATGITTDNAHIRRYRLCVHHLNRKLPASGLLEAAGACGLQNSPPGAWETALFNRIEGCALPLLHRALYEEKTLLQAWSYRGVPVVFPTNQSDIFLSPLAARQGEEPWIYTRGITLALDYLGLSFDELLPLVKEALPYLDCHTIRSKEELDRVLAGLVADRLPENKRKLWNDPSLYGNPDRQTVGGAVVSFLLRPCSFLGLVVFGRRDGISPTFTSYKNWTGHPLAPLSEAEKELVRKYLHCYGPATVRGFAGWLGCSPKQAKRLWNSAAEEMEPVLAEGKEGYMLSADIELLLHPEAGHPEGGGGELLLLGAHDPYLDLPDRSVILPDAALQKRVWKTVANPGAVLKEGKIVGTWKTKTAKDKLEIAVTLFEELEPGEKQKILTCAEEYAAFRRLDLRKCSLCVL